MPKFVSRQRAPPPVGTAEVARTERRRAEAPTPTPPPAQLTTAEEAREQVVADAARLVHWGRKWYELPELIARMAGRPPLAEVRRILKENKSAIDEKAGSA
jgi:2,4-dienoyl-CoA reductase-like NADH-dependent reductase (Old Yellow Enzyme family)